MVTINNPLVSIGLRPSGSPEKLAATLRNLQAQTYANLEITVSDDVTPGPAIIQLLREFSALDPRIKYFLHPTRLDPLSHLKFLLAKATGEFYAWAADGVEWDPRFIERCLAQAGAQGSVMCGISAGGAAVTMPALDPDQSTVKNIVAFLSTPTLALWLGLHRRTELALTLGESKATASPALALFRRVRQRGFKTFDETLCKVTFDQGTFVPDDAGLQSVEPDYVAWALQELRIASENPAEGASRRAKLRKDSSRHLSTLLWERVAASSFGQGQTVCQDAAPWEHCGLPGARDLDAGRQSFSQSGEDMIVDFIFGAIQLDNPTYLDLGAHHPRRYSNTHFFYARGSRGVNVEADPGLFGRFVEERPLDDNLNIGVGVGESGVLPFYVMSTPTLNTFSRAEAERCVGMGTHRIERIIDVPLMGVNDIIRRHFRGSAPDFLSVDVEGLDFEIIKSIDLKRYRPVVICVETITFSEDFDGEKINAIAEYLEQFGYLLYADTSINSIFIDRDRWRRH